MSNATWNETERRDLSTPSPWLERGKLRITTVALELIGERTVCDAIRRHTLGDWGDVSESERAANDRAVKNGGRVHSVYRTANGTVFWVTTEADRSYTTVSFPEPF